jgi:hypothetical protein
VVDLLANGTSRQPGVLCLGRHDAMSLAAHDCSAVQEMRGVYVL